MKLSVPPFWLWCAVMALVAVFCISRFGWRYAGINELKRLEKRVEALENGTR